MATLSPTPTYKAWDNNGNPLANGLLYTYAAGTTIPQATYIDSSQTIQNTNPIVLNFRGECQLWLDPTQSYKFILQDSAANPISTVDSISGVLNGANLGNLTPSATNTYTLGTPSLAWANAYFGANGVALYNPASGNLGYNALAWSETANQVTNYSWAPADIRRYGALSGASPGSGGNGDITTAVQNAMAAYGMAIVPPGDWRMDSTVTLNGTTVYLMAGAVITRYSASSNATTPMFWYQGSNGSIIGCGASSQIVTQNKAPSGVVLNGCASMTSNSPLGQDMLCNTLANIWLQGSTAYGQTSGLPDACYMQINPQLDGKACYFAVLSNVFTNSANFGFWLRGWANGCLMSNLFGKWIGNTTRASPTAQGADAFIFSQGALDNNLTSLFHHFSPSTTTLRVEDLDNTATPSGSLHVTSYSSFRGVASEQGGSAYSLIANGTCTAFANYFELIDNTTQGYSISATFTSTQTNQLLTATNGALLFKAAVQTLLPVQFIEQQKTITYSATMAVDAATGNDFIITATDGNAFTISNPTHSQPGQRITITIRNTSGGALGTLTFDTNYRAATWTQPANGNSRSITFRYFSTVWVEENRTTADIPN